MNLQKGAIRRIYSIDGRPVRSLTDFTDGGLYVAAPNEPFKSGPYTISDTSALQQDNGYNVESSQISQRLPQWSIVGARDLGPLKPDAFAGSYQKQFLQRQGREATEEEKEMPIFTQTVS